MSAASISTSSNQGQSIQNLLEGYKKFIEDIKNVQVESNQQKADDCLRSYKYYHNQFLDKHKSSVLTPEEEKEVKEVMATIEERCQILNSMLSQKAGPEEKKEKSEEIKSGTPALKTSLTAGPKVIALITDYGQKYKSEEVQSEKAIRLGLISTLKEIEAEDPSMSVSKYMGYFTFLFDNIYTIKSVASRMDLIRRHYKKESAKKYWNYLLEIKRYDHLSEDESISGFDSFYPRTYYIESFSFQSVTQFLIEFFESYGPMPLRIIRWFDCAPDKFSEKLILLREIIKRLWALELLNKQNISEYWESLVRITLTRFSSSDPQHPLNKIVAILDFATKYSIRLTIPQLERLLSKLDYAFLFENNLTCLERLEMIFSKESAEKYWGKVGSFSFEQLLYSSAELSCIVTNEMDAKEEKELPSCSLESIRKSKDAIDFLITGDIVSQKGRITNALENALLCSAISPKDVDSIFYSFCHHAKNGYATADLVAELIQQYLLNQDTLEAILKSKEIQASAGSRVAGLQVLAGDETVANLISAENNFVEMLYYYLQASEELEKPFKKNRNILGRSRGYSIAAAIRRLHAADEIKQPADSKGNLLPYLEGPAHFIISANAEQAYLAIQLWLFYKAPKMQALVSTWLPSDSPATIEYSFLPDFIRLLQHARQGIAISGQPPLNEKGVVIDQTLYNPTDFEDIYIPKLYLHQGLRRILDTLADNGLFFGPRGKENFKDIMKLIATGEHYVLAILGKLARAGRLSDEIGQKNWQDIVKLLPCYSPEKLQPNLLHRVLLFYTMLRFLGNGVTQKELESLFMKGYLVCQVPSAHARVPHPRDGFILDVIAAHRKALELSQLDFAQKGIPIAIQIKIIDYMLDKIGVLIYGALIENRNNRRRSQPVMIASTAAASAPTAATSSYGAIQSRVSTTGPSLPQAESAASQSSFSHAAAPATAVLGDRASLQSEEVRPGQEGSKMSLS